jgi:class 3 adenylate cyclase
MPLPKGEVSKSRRSDSYVAVVGLPTRKDHAVVMVRFASDCRDAMMIVTRKLEVTLGPDTGNLELRFGLHSGPVTAGVLR